MQHGAPPRCNLALACAHPLCVSHVTLVQRCFIVLLVVEKDKLVLKYVSHSLNALVLPLIHQSKANAKDSSYHVRTCVSHDEFNGASKI